MAEIRHLHLAEGVPKKETARRLQLDVKTVRRAVGRPTPPARVSPPRPRSLDPQPRDVWRTPDSRGTVGRRGCGEPQAGGAGDACGGHCGGEPAPRAAHDAAGGPGPAGPGPGRAPFRGGGPNRLWVADITYVPTRAGFGFGRRLLRQRDGRELLRDAGVRVARPHAVGDARRFPVPLPFAYRCAIFSGIVIRELPLRGDGAAGSRSSGAAVRRFRAGRPTEARSTGRRRDARLSSGAAGNRLEALRGDRSGSYSIRINDRWRLCFRFADGNAYDAEIVDYH